MKPIVRYSEPPPLAIAFEDIPDLIMRLRDRAAALQAQHPTGQSGLADPQSAFVLGQAHGYLRVARVLEAEAASSTPPTARP